MSAYLTRCVRIRIALLKYQSEQLGIMDHRLQDGKMAVNILEKWKDRENAFQECGPIGTALPRSFDKERAQEKVQRRAKLFTHLFPC